MAQSKRQSRTRQTKAASKSLTKNQFLGATTKSLKRVEIPELGGAVFVRSIRGNEWVEFRDTVMDGEGKVIENTMMARLVALTVCDADGKRLCTNDDWELVNNLPLPPLMRLFRVAMKFNNLDIADVEEIVGNLPKTPSLSSG